MSNCTYKPNSNEPCATCPRKISTLYKCELLKETARETSEEMARLARTLGKAAEEANETAQGIIQIAIAISQLSLNDR